MWAFDEDTPIESVASTMSASPLALPRGLSPKQHEIAMPAPTQRYMHSPTPFVSGEETTSSPLSRGPLLYGPHRPLPPSLSPDPPSFSPSAQRTALMAAKLPSPLDADAKSAREAMEATDALDSVDERRHRRNEKERLRVRGVKDRLETLRHDLAQLQRTHENLQRDLQQQADDTYRNRASDKVVTVKNNQRGAVNVALVRRYLELMDETKLLQQSNLVMEGQMRPRELRTTAVRTMLQLEHEGHLVMPLVHAPSSALTPSEQISGGVGVSAVSLFEHVLFSSPMSLEDALAMVRDTCVEMMELLDREDWEDNGEAFGWQGGRRVQGSRLQFKLSQVFPNEGARELMQKTWTMLTNKDEYKRIQPEVIDYKVLHRINDECWLIASTIQGTPMRHGVVLVARALIHGGYLVTFRSVPMSRAQRQFVEMETGGMIVDIFSWYNFQERPSTTVPGTTECEVIFGGNAQNGDVQFLQRLKLVLLVGITRWQSAVDLAPFQLPSLVTDDSTTSAAATPTPIAR